MKKKCALLGCLILQFVFVACDTKKELSINKRIITEAERADLLNTLIRANDTRVQFFIDKQVVDVSSRDFGGVLDPNGIPSNYQDAALIQTFTCAYVSKSSSYYLSDELMKRMMYAVKNLLATQHPDGTIDLVTTNFHSTPDTGFTIPSLSMAYLLLLQNGAESELAKLIKEFLLKAGDALSVGGIHTPNHRWVVCAALSWVNRLFPNEKYQKRIDQWLAEGIDLDADGQYYERSTATYSPVCNRALITMAFNLGEDYHYLYDYVRKNLNMTLYFMHPNGEIVTESSNRQDKYQVATMSNYYFSYRFMALHDQDQLFSGMVEHIETSSRAEDLLEILPYSMLHPELTGQLPALASLPNKYEKHFPHSDIMRIRNEEVDMSMIMNNPTFFTYFKDNAPLEAMQLATTFFGYGQFQSATIKKEGNAYVLEKHGLRGPYYQPIPKDELLTHDGDYSVMGHKYRKMSEVQESDMTVWITPDGKKAHIRVKIDCPGNNRLVVALQMAFRHGGKLENVVPKQEIKDAYTTKNGEYFTYTKDGSTIKVGPCISQHTWTQLRNALPKQDAQSVYMTCFAPCEFEFTIE